MPQAIHEPNTPEDRAPPPATSPELILWRIQTAAMVGVLGPKKGQRFLRSMAELMANEESIAEITPIRGAASYAAIREARRAAIALYRQALPTLIARLG